jgi:ElaA protein
MKDAQLTWECRPFSALDTQTLYAIMRLRQEVFVVEQACIYQDLDGNDQASFHLCGHRGSELLAYARCLPPGLDYPESSLGRIVVNPTARGLRLGEELVRRAIAFNRTSWPDTGIRIGAQAYLESFYRGFGFATASDVYDEDGIPHIKMVLKESP